MKKTSVIIIDDSVINRDLLTRSLTGVEDVEIVSVAPNGKIGFAKINQFNPDFILLGTNITDIKTVGMVKSVLSSHPFCGILVVTDTKAESAEIAIYALQEGALDFIIMPSSLTESETIATLNRKLLPKIRSFSIKLYSNYAKSLSVNKREEHSYPDADSDLEAKKRSVIAHMARDWKTDKFRAVVIGVSTGGPEALSELIPEIPASFPIPIVITMHMPKHFTASMADALNKKSSLEVKEAEDGDLIAPGHVYLAPGDRHIAIEKKTRQRYFIKTIDSMPENGHKPSVDVLFKSAAEAFDGNVLALILTGMGEDGVKGMKILKKAGAMNIAQDEDSSVVWGMPGSAVKSGCIDKVVPLKDMAQKVLQIVSGIHGNS